MSTGPHAMLWPVFALVALTFVVWVRLFVVRIGEMRRLRIHPQSVATSPQAAQRFVDTRATDNLRNLFELPVLFYAAIAIAFAAREAGSLVLTLAWLFVGLRVAHSAIQCSYNRVMHRFFAHILGAFVLWGLWGTLFVSMLVRSA